MLITKFINIFKVGKVFLNSEKKKNKKKKKKKNKSSKIYILVLAANIFKDFFFCNSEYLTDFETLIAFIKVLDTCRLRILLGLKCLAYM